MFRVSVMVACTYAVRTVGPAAGMLSAAETARPIVSAVAAADALSSAVAQYRASYR